MHNILFVMYIAFKMYVTKFVDYNISASLCVQLF